MSSVIARTGRHRQRYENNFRLVSGCIPYRITEDDEDHHNGDIENRIQVLMVSSPDRDDRVFPKGGWEDDETVLEAACREAFEEAGVKGTLRETPLGVWEFRSKSSQKIESLEGGCRGYMFALEVTEELESWPEQQNRDRKWLNIKEAFRLCRYEWMCRALEEFVRVMEVSDDDEGGKIEIGGEEKGEASANVNVNAMPSVPAVTDHHVVAECQIVSSNCCIEIKPSSTSQQLVISVHCHGTWLSRGLPLSH
ncbi:PREDICTED: nudix hydrolase 12, mitochondrial isoform X2 [Prunus mume]|uniref:Nudix hydrolase 12, mitochondrial isoform X2 n=1 Tax=Prunus mume TaxID=102107 RepID=A0ABM0NXE1_PRUMU|nr:PREDICTED: nudix hydrolase 12, mitochondrial isoform X2 [Prunus mume]